MIANQLHELSYRDCRALLDAESVGRCAVSTPDGPHIVPVNYWADGGSVFLRTAPYTVLGRYAAGSIGAFEIDGFSAPERLGWSVVARGRISPVTEADALEALRVEGRVEAWAPGVRPMFLRLDYTELTGRRIGPVPTADDRGVCHG